MLETFIPIQCPVGRLKKENYKKYAGTLVLVFEQVINGRQHLFGMHCKHLILSKVVWNWHVSWLSQHIISTHYNVVCVKHRFIVNQSSFGRPLLSKAHYTEFLLLLLWKIQVIFSPSHPSFSEVWWCHYMVTWRANAPSL